MRALFPIIALMVLFGCKKTDKAPLTDGIIIGFVPSEEAERMAKNLSSVTDYLSRKLDTRVTLFKGNDYTAVIEAMRAEKLDIAVFGPFSYILASERVGAEPLVVPADKEGHPATYNSFIVANKKTGLTNLEDLMDASGQYTLSFSDPASTSGHLVPKGHMMSLGIRPQSHFTEIIFSGSHTATIFALASGKIDVADCSKTVFNQMIERGMLNADEVEILWKSLDLPVDLVTIRKGFSEEIKEKIKDAYVKMAQEAPETAGYFYEEWNDSTLVYIPAFDEMYSEIHRLAEYVNKENNK